MKPIKYYFEKWKLERLMRKDKGNYMEHYIKWCAHTDSMNIIYTTYTRPPSPIILKLPKLIHSNIKRLLKEVL